MPTGTTGRAGWGCAAAPATALRRRYRHGLRPCPAAAHHGRHRAPRRRHRTPPRRAAAGAGRTDALTLNRRRVPGNTKPVTSRSTRASSSTARARSESGTRCSRPVFILEAGTVHVADSRSISPHVANRTSPDRAAVNVRNSKASRVLMPAPDDRTAARVPATSPYGSARWWRGPPLPLLRGSAAVRISPAGLSSRWPSAIAHFMTVPIRCRTRRAPVGVTTSRSPWPPRPSP